MSWYRRVAVALILAVAASGTAAAEPADYRLGPQDQLEIKVYDLRAGTGEAYQWTAFNGTFTVSAAGRVSLPLVGEVDAGDKTTADLAAAIAGRLQSKVGLAQKPDASVQVVKFRPFYITGSVDKPGEYDYRPGLTVLQAVSIAGGLTRVPFDSLTGYGRDTLKSQGDLRVLSAARIALLARQARLDAEVKDADAMTVPDELRPRIGAPEVDRILREEQSLFDARHVAIRSQTAQLEQTKTLLQHEVESLTSKDATAGRQLDITRKELQQITGLVSKGLTVLPRQLEMEQSEAQYQSNRLDIQLATLRAQQDISKADRDILELHNSRRSDALKDLAEVRDKLAETNETIRTTLALVDQAQGHAPPVLSVDAASPRSPDYFLTRQMGGKAETRAAREDGLVQPGDVLRVIPKAKPGGGEAADRTASSPASDF